MFSSCFAFLEMESSVTTGTKYLAVWTQADGRRRCLNCSRIAFATGQILECDISVLRVIQLVGNANKASARCQSSSKIATTPPPPRPYRGLLGAGYLFPRAAKACLSAVWIAHFTAHSFTANLRPSWELSHQPCSHPPPHGQGVPKLRCQQVSLYGMPNT